MVTYLVYFLFISCLYHVNEISCIHLDEYLDETSKFLQEQLWQRKRFFNKRDSSNIVIENIEENIISGTHDYIKMFIFLNKTYMLTKQNLYEIQSSSKFKVVPQNNTFEKVLDSEKITFTRDIMFDNINFIIIKSEIMGEAYVYLSNRSNKFSLIQTLFVPDAVDAHFFINNRNLYLMVANNKGDNLAVTSIYKWLGFHFDEIQTVFTTGAIKVGSFTTRTTEIIIILQDLSNRTVPSFVYQFSNEEIVKLQHLRTTDPVHMNIYSNSNESYIIIYGRSKNNIIYRWNDFDFMAINKFQSEEVVYRSETFEVNKTNLIIVPTNENIQIYSLNFGKIKLEVKHQYRSNYSKILDIQKGISENLYVVGFSNNLELILNSIHIFSINSEETEATSSEKEDISECFKNLELMINTDNLVVPEGPILQESFDKKINKMQAESLNKEFNIDTAIKQLQVRLDHIKLLADPDNLIIEQETTVKSRIFAKKLKANNIILKSLNRKKWTPDVWLKYEEPQVITGAVKFSTLITDHLETVDSNPIFKDLLLKNGNQVFTESLSIGNLTANAFHVQNINNVSIEDVYLKNHPTEISGLKIFDTLNVEEVKASSLNAESPNGIVSAILNSTDFNPNNLNAERVEIENLIVHTINNVSWNEFRNSVFRVNVTTKITGSLRFNSLRTERLSTRNLENIEVDTLLTTSTDQNITADLEITKILLENVTADIINNKKLTEENILLANETDLITGVIQFDKVIVQRDLNVTGHLNNSLFMRSGDHVFGTKQSDLLQTYTGKTVINNLYLKNLNLLSKTKLIISDTEVSKDLTKVYWSKSTKQEIPVAITFAKGFSVPHLNAEMLNDIKIEKLFLNNNGTKMETKFDFENVTVIGNVILQNHTQHTPSLKKILEESVKKTGSYVIQGKKVILGTLKVENLETSELGGINISQTLNKKWPKNVTATKTIQHLIVSNNADSNFEGVSTINDVPIDSIRNKFIFIDKPYNVNLLKFAQVNVENLHVTNINGQALEDYFSLNRALNNITVLQKLTIHSNVSIGHLLNMSSLNDIPYEELSKKALHVGKNVIEDDVKFTRSITVKNLVTSSVNNINLKALMKRMLTRNTNQNITAPYNFTNIKIENLVTPAINNISVQNMIDIHSDVPQNIILPNGLELSDVVLNSIRANKFTPCSIEEIKNEFADPPTQEWTEVEIKGDVILLDDKNLLYKIFEKSVRQSTRNVIHSPVNFSSNVLIENLNTAKPINGIGIAELLEDAVLSESDKPQIISGTKWFLTLHTKDALILNNLDTKFLNNESVVNIDEIIVDKNDKNKVIRGMKTFFAGLQTDKFNSNHISKISPNNLVNLDNLKAIPEAICDRLEVNNNLNIKFYGNVNFTDVILNRLTIDGDEQIASGIYYFENLEVEDLVTSSINDVKIDDVIFDVGTQNIFGKKHFFQPIRIIGNASIDLINGINLTDRFEKVISTEGPINITGSVIIMKPVSGNGTILTESINGQSISKIKKILATNDQHIESDEIFNIKTDLIKKIINSRRMTERLPGEFMYLEKSNVLQISIPNVVRASSVTTNENIVMHVNGHESGAYCGLPNNCTCPLQYTIEISPLLSVSIFPKKGFQRIFTYDDNKSIINILTNSVSTGNICRTSTSKLMNEVSMLTWTTKTTGNNIGVFYQYDKFFTGYISKVDFFTLNEKSYALIGRYYDPVRDSYNLDCTVIRFDENRITATDIQKISTKGVQEVYVFHTAQGLTLVLGNKIPSDVYHEQDNTKIYRFNPEIEQFAELRTIPSFGCSIATGIVVGADSLIALAHNEAPVQVLKYHHEFDNYYFYQSFLLEDQVIALSSFYTGDFGISEAYLSIVTSNERYYIYSYQFLEGFKLKSKGELEGLRNLIPMKINTQLYLFAPSAKNSSLLTIVKSGSS